MRSSWPLLREVFLFLAGLAGVAHETLGKGVDRPTLLAVFTVMMGLPLVIPLTRKNGNGSGSSGSGSS